MPRKGFLANEGHKKVYFNRKSSPETKTLQSYCSNRSSQIVKDDNFDPDASISDVLTKPSIERPKNSSAFGNINQYFEDSSDVESQLDLSIKSEVIRKHHHNSGERQLPLKTPKRQKLSTDIIWGPPVPQPSKLQQTSLDLFFATKRKRSSEKRPTEHTRVNLRLSPPTPSYFEQFPRSSEIKTKDEADQTNIQLASVMIRSPLVPEFEITIKLTSEEEKFYSRLKYFYTAAASRLREIPSFPESLHPFNYSGIEVQLDRTEDRRTHSNLLQVFCAGQCAAHILTGESLKLPQDYPEWCSPPTSTPLTFLNKMAEFLMDRDFLLSFPNASINDLFILADKLKTRKVQTRYFGGQLSWKSLNKSGVLLFGSSKRPDGEPMRTYDGAILPAGVTWEGIPCGSVRIQLDETIEPVRTVFIHKELTELNRRLTCDGKIVSEKIPLLKFGVDLCSGSLGIIFENGDCREQNDNFKLILEKLIRRTIKATKFFKFVIIFQLTNCANPMLVALFDKLEQRHDVVDYAEIQVIAANMEPAENTLKKLILTRGDDLSDYAFLSRKDNKIFETSKMSLSQSPHESLVSDLENLWKNSK